jgi:hypothetical protein
LSGLSQSWCGCGSVELTRAPGLPETLEEERLSYLGSLRRHAATGSGEVRSVVALKPGVGDHTPERFADHELGSCYCGLGQIRRRAAIDPWSVLDAFALGGAFEVGSY